MKLLQVDNLKELHFFVDNLNFPVAIYIRSDWEKTQLSYLNPKVHTSESLCRWCIAHNIIYQIIYPISKVSILKNPYKFLKYLHLKTKLK